MMPGPGLGRLLPEHGVRAEKIAGRAVGILVGACGEWLTQVIWYIELTIRPFVCYFEVMGGGLGIRRA